MIKRSYQELKYTNYKQEHLINVWAKDGSRELVVKRKLLNDKDFKLTSLQMNPLYKPVFDKMDAVAVKELAVLDKSTLWSRNYQKEDFKHKFLYPWFIFAIIIFCSINYGVKNRIYV